MSPRAHRQERVCLGDYTGELKMNINLLEPENKSFMVRKISNVNLSLNSEADEWQDLSRVR